MACRASGAAPVRLLLDEMLSAVIAQQLRDRGHDAQAIAGHSLHPALSDREVMDLARARRRAVVTNNLVDVRPRHHEAITPGGPGAFRRTKADTGRIVTVLEAKLAEFPGERDLANGEIWH
jgi:hypothetical protein